LELNRIRIFAKIFGCGMRGEKMKGQVWAACLTNCPRLLGRGLLLSYTGVPGHAHIKLPSSIKCRVVGLPSPCGNTEERKAPPSPPLEKALAGRRLASDEAG